MKLSKRALIAALALTAAAAWQSAAMADEVVKIAAEDEVTNEFSVDGGMAFEDDEAGSLTVVDDGGLSTAVYSIAQIYRDGDAAEAAQALKEYDVDTRMAVLAQLAVEDMDAYKGVIEKQYPEITELGVYSNDYDEMKTVLRAVLVPNSVEPKGSFRFSVTGSGVVDKQSELSEKTADFTFDAKQIGERDIMLSGEATYEFGMEVPGIFFSEVSEYTAVFTPDAE